MSHFVERLEDELVRAGFGRRARLRRVRRPAMQVSGTVVVVLATLFVIRPGIEREHEATPAPTAVACAGAAAPVTGAVDAGLLALLGALRNPPLAQQTADAATCAERSVDAGGRRSPERRAGWRLALDAEVSTWCPCAIGLRRPGP